MSENTEEKQIFHTHLRATGNKLTNQRDLILDVFLKADGHLSAEEIYHRVKTANPLVGFTTVYRTLKLLVGAGLAREEKFSDSHVRYECSHNREHHDHLICEGCGLVIEFYSSQLEREQDRIISKYGFQATHHSHRIFGLCKQCQPKQSSKQSGKQRSRQPGKADG